MFAQQTSKLTAVPCFVLPFISMTDACFREVGSANVYRCCHCFIIYGIGFIHRGQNHIKNAGL
jgi:hypothetical protein